MSSQDIDPRLRALSSASQLPTLQPNPRHPPSIPPHPNSASTSSISPLPYPLIHNTASPHNQPAVFFPNTPQSIGNVAEHDQGAGSSDGGQIDAKRPRACEACRGLKVKCQPDANGDGPCKRCAKANRACEVTQPSRKRQKKTDSRVADLEKKIEILQRLTANIHPKAAESALLEIDPQTPQAPSPYQPVSENAFRSENSQSAQRSYASNDWPSYAKSASLESKQNVPMVVEAGRQKRKYTQSQDNSTTGSTPNKANEAQTLIDQCTNAWAEKPDVNRAHAHIYSDVVDRNIVSAEDAEQIFDCYNQRMAIHFPAVVFPPGTTASTIRKERPILFLAILAAGAGPMFPEIQLNLIKEVTSIYATRIMINGEKSLELVQALQVSTIWYYPPEHFEELKFYQLVHIAAVMAIDIGLGKPNKASKPGTTTAGIFRDNPWRKQPFPDSDAVEARRTWLACYFLCCNTSMGLRRPNLIRWTPYMADCLRVLESSPEAFSSDKTLCAWIRSQHIAEEVGYQFSMDDPGAKVSIAEDKVNYALKKFEQDLVQWHEEMPPEARSHSLDMTGHVISLYMHEIAMHVDHNVDEFRPPYHESTINGLISDYKPQPLTTSHVEALSACLTAIDGVFEVFLRHSVEVVRCLPVANFVRVAYAAVVLMKMSLAASHSESGIGKIFVASNLKTEEYLDSLINLFSAASAEHKSRPSSKFLMVLVMLKTWFHRRLKYTRKTGEPDDRVPVALESSRESKQGQIQGVDGKEGQSTQSYVPTNTPLDVLSDVATGNSRGQPGAPNQYAAQSNDWPQPPMQQQFQAYPVNMMQQSFPAGLGNSDVNLNNFAGFNYSVGDDGFENVVGMTLAGFGAYLGDDFMNNGYEYTGF